MKFAKEFIWGAATSSYQVEGAAYRDGGGRSIWDMLGQQRGRIAHGDTGEVACDHYHRYKDDVALMAEVGLQAYRFSVSWPRVLPEGVGRANGRGLEFYNRLVDELLENNITPWITLFHWDFPYALYCRGGWLNRDSADWFADYTRLVVEQLSDRVSHWVTLNEPQCFIGMGHQDGVHAPGLELGISEVLLAGHNALRAHGKAVQVIRANARTPALVGASQASKISIPDSDRTDDVDAARQHMFSVRKKHLFNNAWFSDPMILGHYPDEGVELFGGEMPEILAGDMECINQALDYFGANIYSGNHVRAAGRDAFECIRQKDLAETEMGWPVTPEALYWGPKFFHERYHLPVVITESGMANNDTVQDGKVEDKERIEFLSHYLHEYARVNEQGVPVLGFFLWSLLDNFEWAEGYSKRFGIVYVDYETQQRIPKRSAYWYKDLIASHQSTHTKDAIATVDDESIVDPA